MQRKIGRRRLRQNHSRNAATEIRGTMKFFVRLWVSVQKLIGSVVRPSTRPEAQKPVEISDANRKTTIAINSIVNPFHQTDSDNKVTRINTPDAIDYLNHGNNRYTRKKYDQAITYYSEAIRLDSQLAVAYNNRGLCYTAKKEPDQAIIDYSEAIRLNPHYADAHNNRGLSYAAKGDYDQAFLD